MLSTVFLNQRHSVWITDPGSRNTDDTAVVPPRAAPDFLSCFPNSLFFPDSDAHEDTAGHDSWVDREEKNSPAGRGDNGLKNVSE